MKKRLAAGEHHEVKIIAEIVAKYFDLSLKELTMETRKRHIVYPRHIYHYICHKKKGFTTYKSAFVTNKDHATVLNSCKQVENWLSYDKVVKKEIKDIEGIIKKGDVYFEVQKMIDEVPHGWLPRVKKELEKYIIA